MRENFAPRAVAATMSAPFMMPVSTMIVASLPTSRTTAGRRWKGMGARSSWRPPWLDSRMPSTPRSMSRTASGTFWTPLMTILPGHISRMIRRSSSLMVGSMAESSSSPTVPPVDCKEANSSLGVVRKSNHHQGRGMALSTVPGVIWGGMEKPLRLSRRRAPATGVSTVNMRVSKPAAAARSTSP